MGPCTSRGSVRAPSPSPRKADRASGAPAKQGSGDLAQSPCWAPHAGPQGVPKQQGHEHQQNAQCCEAIPLARVTSWEKDVPVINHLHRQLGKWRQRLGCPSFQGELNTCRQRSSLATWSRRWYRWDLTEQKTNQRLITKQTTHEADKGTAMGCRRLPRTFHSFTRRQTCPASTWIARRSEHLAGDREDPGLLWGQLCPFVPSR